MTLIKDLIDIPERVQKGDFVLRLAEDVARPDTVLDNYVVTPELRKCFDAALSLIGNAVRNRSSKATFLHGSFGSGKSHFMAVLHLMLQGNPTARGIPELAEVVAKHAPWLAGKKFLLVPYHMIGAASMEEGVLGGYVEFVRRTHPQAPIPPVYVSAGLIAQARAERESYGDEPFFRRLNAGLEVGGWGDLEATWDATTFDDVAAADPNSPEHRALVSRLLTTTASSHGTNAGQFARSFVRFDQGLSLLSRHAADLGYDAVILFLDELILWLAVNSADLGFVKREAAKLTLLVEAQSAERPIPLVSFVARQRDLRELVGDHVPGAEKLSFGDSLDWQQGRFDTIALEDRNLPAIAEKRILKCRSAAARTALDGAFEQTGRIKENVLGILLTREGDRQMFRRVYPFSPALVQTLIAVSSVLQRERTALKVMMQLLVDQRETLRLGDIVPVGDLFDVIAHGDEAFSQEMAIHFDNAKRLYHRKLLPALEQEHGLRREDLERLPPDDPKRIRFRNDDRLVKTLLLSALVPEVETLRALTAEKLAALNHGTIKSPIPGQERTIVLNKVRGWVAGGVGEIRIGDEANPTITVQLSGVDTESIIEQARREDGQGNRIRRVRQMLFELLGIEGQGEYELDHDFLWRNTPRRCKVLFRNVRELKDVSLENAGENWNLIVDWPFDEAGHGPRDDLSTIRRFTETHPEGSKTVCWLPSFFSGDAQRDLGMLVIHEHILAGERFGQYSHHLSPQDRLAARSILESRRSQLRQRVQQHLEAAYGLGDAESNSLDASQALELNERVVSLKPGFVPQPPVAADLAGAMRNILGQALEHEFPAAPEFGTEIRGGVLKKTYEAVLQAARTQDGRQPIDKTLRPLLRQTADPLRLGEMGPDATHFVLGRYWLTHFDRKASEAGGDITVARLRQWIDDPKPMGLPKDAQNIVIAIYAAQSNRIFFQHGAPYDGAPASLPDICELRSIELPPQSEWGLATVRAGHIFGTAVSELLSGANTTALAKDVKEKSQKARKACRAYCVILRQRLREMKRIPEECPRFRTAAGVEMWIDKLWTLTETNDIVHFLATAPIAGSETGMAASMTRAEALDGVLNGSAWQTFELIAELSEPHRATADSILNGVRAALTADEYDRPLAPAVKAAEAEAMVLLRKAVIQPPPPPPPVRDDNGPDRKGGKDRDTEVKDPIPGSKSKVTIQEALETLNDLKRNTVAGRRLQIDMNWIYVDGETS